MNAHIGRGKVEASRISLGVLSLWVIGVMLLSVSCAAPTTAPAGPAAVAVTQPPAQPAQPMEPSPVPEELKLPPPVTCDPANPMLDSVAVVKGPETGRYGQDIYTMEAMYTNAKLSQEFLLTASSKDPKMLNSVVGGLKACYEVLDTGTPDTSGGKSDTSEEEDRKRAFDFLQNNPNNVLFEFQLTAKGGFNPENVVVVYFVVDPTLDADRVDDFLAKCCFSAFISVGVSNNSAQAELFRAGGSINKTNTAMPGRSSTTVSHNNGAVRTTYDARVYGPGGTTYWVAGTWTKGGSTISTNVCP